MDFNRGNHPTSFPRSNDDSKEKVQLYKDIRNVRIARNIKTFS